MLPALADPDDAADDAAAGDAPGAMYVPTAGAVSPATPDGAATAAGVDVNLNEGDNVPPDSAALVAKISL